MRISQVIINAFLAFFKICDLILTLLCYNMYYILRRVVRSWGTFKADYSIILFLFNLNALFYSWDNSLIVMLWWWCLYWNNFLVLLLRASSLNYNVSVVPRLGASLDNHFLNIFVEL